MNPPLPPFHSLATISAALARMIFSSKVSRVFWTSTGDQKVILNSFWYFASWSMPWRSAWSNWSTSTPASIRPGTMASILPQECMNTFNPDAWARAKSRLKRGKNSVRHKAGLIKV
jgi:hypothetical protein